MVLTSVLVLPGAHAMQVSAPEPIPNTSKVGVTITFDDPDLVELDGLRLHFDCSASGQFTDAMPLVVGATSEHAVLIQFDTSGASRGYGYQQVQQTGYGYVAGSPGTHGYDTGVRDVIPAGGYGYGYGYSNGYGYGYDSGSLTFVFDMVQSAFVADETCTLVIEAVPAGELAGDFESPRSDPFVPRATPIADAGTDQVVPAGARVELDGSLSIDPNDGPEPLSYFWSQLDASPVALTGATTATPTFDAPDVDADQTMHFLLRVFDGLDNDTALVNVTVHSGNLPPLANAGLDFFGTAGRTAHLLGLGLDPDLDDLSYQWTQVTPSPAVTLVNATAAHASFLVPSVAADTPVTFRLNVTDGFLWDTDDVVVTFIQEEAPQVTMPSLTAVIESLANPLLATATDRNGDALSYEWRILSGPPGTFGAPVAPGALNSTSVLQPTFFPPENDDTATTTLQLTVGDGRGFNVTRQVTYTVRDNEAPRADAGSPFELAGGQSLQVLGAADDPEDDAVTYAWSTSDASLTLAGADTATPTVTAAANAADHSAVLVLNVTDAFGAYGRDSVEVLVRSSQLQADAGFNQVVSLGSRVYLDGSASTGSITSYAWAAVGDAPALDDANTVEASFLATAISFPATYTYRLTVTGPAGTSTDDVTVTVIEGTVAETWYLHTADCLAGLVDVGLGIPSEPSNTATRSPEGDAELCIRPTVNVAGSLVPVLEPNPVDFAATAERTVAAGTQVTGELYIALLLPDREGGALPPLDGVKVEVSLQKAGASIGGAEERASTAALFGMAPAELPGTLPGLPVHYVKVPFTFQTTGALAVDDDFAFRVRVAPTVGLAYIIGQSGTEHSFFTFPGSGAAGAPLADAGQAQTVAEGTQVTLSGSSVPAATSSEWMQVSGPRVTLTGAQTSQATFTAPQVLATTPLQFRFVARGADGLTGLDDVVVTVTDSASGSDNADPVPSSTFAAGSSTVNIGDFVHLSGTASDDAGDFVDLRWTQPSPAVQVGGFGERGDRRFIAPEVTQTTTFLFELTARDNHGAVETLLVPVTVLGPGSETSTTSTSSTSSTTDSGNDLVAPPPAPSEPAPEAPQAPIPAPANNPGTPASPGGGQQPAPPADLDSDGDGVPDRIEILLGTDPFAASSVPSFDITDRLVVRRIGTTNLLSWAPLDGVLGYQLWSSNSPYTLLGTVDADGESSYPDAAGRTTTKYKLTFFVDRTAAGGYLTDASGLETLSGWDEGSGSTLAPRSGGGSAVRGDSVAATWVPIVVVGVVALLAIALAVGYLGARRK